MLAVAVALFLAGCRSSGRPRGHAARQPGAKYHCPMHPTYVSDKPGDCPICGMKLVPIEKPAAARGSPSARRSRAGGRAATIPRAPIAPRWTRLRSDKPSQGQHGHGLRARLRELQDGRRGAAGPARRHGPRGGHAHARAARAARRAQRGGAPEAHRRSASAPSAASTADERRLAHVHTKFEGYVEHLYVDFTGKLVKKGEPLLSIYSPELVATQQEYLLALRAQKQLGSERDSRRWPRAARTCSRRRASGCCSGTSAPRTSRSSSGRARSAAPSTSTPTSAGYVVQKNAVQGMRVMPADTLFDIADLSHLWVLADVYESDLPQHPPRHAGRGDARLPAGPRRGAAP